MGKRNTRRRTNKRRKTKVYKGGLSLENRVKNLENTSASNLMAMMEKFDEFNEISWGVNQGKNDENS